MEMQNNFATLVKYEDRVELEDNNYCINEYWTKEKTLLKSLTFYDIDDKLHNSIGPACIEYNMSSNEELFIAYYMHGMKHRTDGPAAIGNYYMLYKDYFLNDIEYSETEYLVECKK